MLSHVVWRRFWCICIAVSFHCDLVVIYPSLVILLCQPAVNVSTFDWRRHTERTCVSVCLVFFPLLWSFVLCHLLLLNIFDCNLSTCSIVVVQQMPPPSISVVFSDVFITTSLFHFIRICDSIRVETISPHWIDKKFNRIKTLDFRIVQSQLKSPFYLRRKSWPISFIFKHSSVCLRARSSVCICQWLWQLHDSRFVKTKIHHFLIISVQFVRVFAYLKQSATRQNAISVIL